MNGHKPPPLLPSPSRQFIDNLLTIYWPNLMQSMWLWVRQMFCWFKLTELWSLRVESLDSMNQWIDHTFGWSILINCNWQNSEMSQCVVSQSHNMHRFQNLSFYHFESILYGQNTRGFDPSFQGWFTLFRLIDNTIVATVWVTHGFRCSNHETWVITESATHFCCCSILTIGKLLPKLFRQYNCHWHESVVGWVSPFPRRNFARN